MSARDREQDAVKWLWYAIEDIQVAKMVASSRTIGGRYVCWLAQQAVEKALKAILVFEGIDFRRIHDLARLRGLVPGGWTVREYQTGLGKLTSYSI